MALLKKVMDTDVVPYKAHMAIDRAIDGCAAASVDNDDAPTLAFEPDLDSPRPRGGVSTTMSLTLSVEGAGAGGIVDGVWVCVTISADPFHNQDLVAVLSVFIVSNLLKLTLLCSQEGASG